MKQTCKIDDTFFPVGNVEIRVIVCTVWQYLNEEDSCKGPSVKIEVFFIILVCKIIWNRGRYEKSASLSSHSRLGVEAVCKIQEDAVSVRI